MKNLPLYLQIGPMSELIGISIKELERKKEILFFKGVHYFIPKGRRNTLWKVDEMIKWIESDYQVSEEAAQIIDQIIS